MIGNAEMQYNERVYKLASDNAKYNSKGKAIIQENDEWRDEKEWDAVLEQILREQEISD